MSGTLGLSTGRILVQQQVTRWTGVQVQVLSSQGRAVPTHTVFEKEGACAYCKHSDPTLSSCLCTLPVTIIEHSSVSGCSESARIWCKGWCSSQSSMQLTLTEIPCSLFGSSEDFLQEPVHEICIGGSREQGLPKLVCEVGIICSLTRKIY